MSAQRCGKEQCPPAGGVCRAHAQLSEAHVERVEWRAGCWPSRSVVLSTSRGKEARRQENRLEEQMETRHLCIWNRDVFTTPLPSRWWRFSCTTRPVAPHTCGRQHWALRRQMCLPRDATVPAVYPTAQQACPSDQSPYLVMSWREGDPSWAPDSNEARGLLIGWRGQNCGHPGECGRNDQQQAPFSQPPALCWPMVKPSLQNFASIFSLLPF